MKKILFFILAVVLALLLFNFYQASSQKFFRSSLDAFVGLSYARDAVTDPAGRYVTFNHPDRELKNPGLNCSGLVVAASRKLFNRNFLIEEVIKDYNQNSGPDAAIGHDWDFGWDLFYNLSHNQRRKVFDENLKRLDPEKVIVENFRGFAVSRTGLWQELFSKMNSRAVYGVVYNGFNTRKNNQLQYFHVALMIKDRQDILFYSASRENPNRGVDVHRLNIESEFEQLMSQNKYYKDTRVIVWEMFPR